MPANGDGGSEVQEALHGVPNYRHVHAEQKQCRSTEAKRRGNCGCVPRSTHVQLCCAGHGHFFVILVVYFVTGVVYYSSVEGALFKDEVASSAWQGLYFTVATITTVGFGDMGPKTQGARIFTCCFSLLGLSFGGLALGMVSSCWGDEV